jgi:hypothetical protein
VIRWVSGDAKHLEQRDLEFPGSTRGMIEPVALGICTGPPAGLAVCRIGWSCVLASGGVLRVFVAPG